MNRLLLLAFALVLCVTSGALHAAPFQQVLLPNVVGMPATEAKAKLEGAGFKVKLFNESSQAVTGAPGESAVVTSMQPTPTFEQMSFSGGTEVSLMIVDQVTVPHLVGSQVKDAIITCNEVGLVLTVAGLRPSGNDTRIICDQSPLGGTLVPRGSFVNAMVNCPGTENLTIMVVFGALAGAVVGAVIGAYLGSKAALRSR